MAHLKQKIQIQADFFVIWEFTIFRLGFSLAIFSPTIFRLRFFRPHLNFPTKLYFTMLL